MMIEPFKPGSNRTLLSAATANELIWALNALLSLEVRRGSKDMLHVADGNAVLELKRSDSLFDPFSQALTKRVRVKFVLADALACVELTGADTEGETLIMVARPPELRCSITGEAIGALLVSYTYASAQQRTATCTGYESLVQQVAPPYDVDETNDQWTELCVIRATTNLSVVGVAGTDDWVDYFYPELATGGMVSVSCSYMDLNVGARGWATVPSDPTP